ncbi:mannan endo-1,4-beta-mannosidase 7-like [Nymphaea colorata]|nr:mannan endo-1,4-beta-mannosidase 7-like [Nymphaea colorata]
MKHLPLIFLLLLLLVQKNGVPAEAQKDFVRIRGLHFVINGYPFYANGFNAYWLMYVASDPSQRGKVTSAFQQASSHGLTVARTWAFSDGGYGALQYSPGVYNEQMFRGLDFVVSEARRYGIKLILSLANNYDSFGGKKQYVSWARNQGQYLSSDDDFFRNPVVKGYYKNHVTRVLTRVNSITGVAYKDDPTIFAWELMNEPRCTSDNSGATVQAWITEMAAHVKSIDRNHLLEAGIEGFYGPSSPRRWQFNAGVQVGTDFIRNNQVPGIDFATVHSYPDIWLENSGDAAQFSFLNNWLDAHIQDAQNVLRKPLYFAEFGISSRKSGYSVDKRNRIMQMVYGKIYASARSGGSGAGGLFWQLLAPGMDSYRDGYEIVLNEDPSTSNLIAQQSYRLKQFSRLLARDINVRRWNRAQALRRAWWSSRSKVGRPGK